VTQAIIAAINKLIPTSSPRPNTLDPPAANTQSFENDGIK